MAIETDMNKLAKKYGKEALYWNDQSSLNIKCKKLIFKTFIYLFVIFGVLLVVHNRQYVQQDL